MRHTVFNTPVLCPLFRFIARAGFWLSGWKIAEPSPRLQKYVLIGAPHTSNWDFPIAIGMALLSHTEIHWLGKHSLFEGPFGGFMRWLGGLPVVRTQRNDLVAHTSSVFKAEDHFVLALAPEGTRSPVDTWKSGFYRIAEAAEVPIVLGYADFKHKRAGFGPAILPSGNYERDLRQIFSFYAKIQPRRPERFKLPLLTEQLNR